VDKFLGAKGDNTHMKRVWCLYRVSTIKQVSGEDDIPMQKNACHRFVNERLDWKITNEIYEKGVSGWKLSADDRDEMNVIRKAAKNREFDVLLVFKNDRIGRRENETPFVINFLIENGIEVWSTKDGQSKVENHVDKLINYITYWQASGESQNTSIRVKEAMEQMNEQAKYTGSNPPYGFEVYDTGQKHWKYDKNIKDLRVSETEKKVVKLIFDLYTNKGYGTPRITQYLNNHGYKTRKGNDWRINTVFSILKNPIYIGKKRYNVKNKSDHSKNLPQEDWKLSSIREDWIIINEDTFLKVQQLMDNRRGKQKKPMPRKGKLLLNGLAYCGYCEEKLYSDMGSNSYTLKDGTKKVRQINRYRCLKARQSTVHHDRNLFTNTKYEATFEEELNGEIQLLKEKIEFEESLVSHKKREISIKKDEVKMIQKQINEKRSELDDLNNEVIKAIRGKSSFSSEQLSRVMEFTQQEIDELISKLKEVEKELELVKSDINQESEIKDIILNWENKYEKADFDGKKMLISKVINKVHFFKDNVKIEVKFKQSI
jgi:site-specific DNA recombinase